MIAKGAKSKRTKQRKQPNPSIRMKQTKQRLNKSSKQTMSRKRATSSRKPAATILSTAEFTAGGRHAAMLHTTGKRDRKEINLSWYSCLLGSTLFGRPEGFSWDQYHEAASKFLEAYALQAEIPAPDVMLMPTTRSVAAIVTVMNEEQSLVQILSQLNLLPLNELIVVINGSDDRSMAYARMIPEALVVHYDQPLGHDVGRAIGAKLSDSDILLFVDGDMAIDAKDLLPFIYAVDRGTDVALNNISPYLPIFGQRDSVTRMKEFVNRALRRPDLEANSLTAVPHALSRKAVSVIGCPQLAIPPKAQALAILHRLQVSAPTSVDVISRNRIRPDNIGPANQVANMIIGDHLEALNTAMRQYGDRLTFTDTMRKRWLAKGRVRQ